MEKARNGEMFRLPSGSRPPGSTSVRNISGSSRSWTTPVRMVKYRPVGIRTATRMYDEKVSILSKALWSISIELCLLHLAMRCGSCPATARVPPVFHLSLPLMPNAASPQGVQIHDSRPVHPPIIGNLLAETILAAIALNARTSSRRLVATPEVSAEEF